jgi:hypothetical protein
VARGLSLLLLLLVAGACGVSPAALGDSGATRLLREKARH